MTAVRPGLCKIATLAMIAAAPASATYSSSCGGKGQTPDIQLVVNGAGEVVKSDFRQLGRPILTEPSLRWQIRADYQMILMTAYRRTGQPVARLRLRPIRQSGEWTGTFVLGRRTYWIRCDGFG